MTCKQVYMVIQRETKKWFSILKKRDKKTNKLKVTLRKITWKS